MEGFIEKHISQNTSIHPRAVSKTIELLNNGSTVPFIARYRKEMTGSLDEVQISVIKNELQKIKDLIKRKETILSSIADQGALTKALKLKIENCWESTVLEDLYLPFKKKIKTKGTIAKENGLEPLARIMITQQIGDIRSEGKKYINKKVPDLEAVLEGTRHIMAEWINENSKCRDYIRQAYNHSAIVESKVIKSKKNKAAKFEMYFDYSESLKKMPSHRLLAIFRGEKEALLRVKLKIDEENAEHALSKLIIKNRAHQSASQIKLAIADALKRLIFPSIENQTKKAAKLKADQEAIKVFVSNLEELLLAAPLGSKNILAIDPGYRTGCKLVCLDKNGNLLHNETIYPHPPQKKVSESINAIEYLIEKYQIEAVAVGNGTAGKESYKLIKNIKFEKAIDVFLVNENGASIYSASKIAREEFPNHDITVKGAVSIGRRLMDPLAELVKIDPKSIGVGQYQHDVNQNLLKENLETTIESCVNKVGINLNTASQHVLTFVSGLGPVLAKNIVNYRSENGAFKKRKELLKVPRMGQKAFEQSAGFLRIRKSKNPLDNTAVHPESYKIVEHMAADINKTVDQLINSPEVLKEIKITNYVTKAAGLPTLKDILKELKKPGLDPRGHAEAIQFSDHINSLDDLNEGMILNGIVSNVTKFGAFIDIGIKESGMVHISEITNRFIKDPAEILKVNQKVKVKVISIDKAKNRVGLSMKQV